MKVLFTFPGKLGDSFHQWPVAYQWHKLTGEKFSIGLDKRMLTPVAGLFGAQKCVEKVYLLEGIEHYRLGGQPFDFQLPPSAYKMWDAVYHLGYRDAPTTQLTLASLDYQDFASQIDHTQLGYERTLFGSRPPELKNRLLLHGTRYNYSGLTPFFWKALFDSRDLLEKEFEEIVFIGSPADRRLAKACGYEEFADKGNFITLVDYMQDSRLVLGCGSAMVALAGALKVPSIRIHDTVADGGLPCEVFSNLGEHQWNLPEETNYKEEIAKCLASLPSAT